MLYITQTLPPEPGSTKRPLKHAVCLRKLGCTVTILTTMPNYPLGRIFDGYRYKLWLRENIEGVDVIRVWSLPAANRGWLRRSLSHLSFALAAVVVGLLISRRDLVIARVPNLGTDLAGVVIACLKRGKVLLELADLIPDNLILLGISRDSVISRMLSAYSRLIYRWVDLIAVPGSGMLAVLQQRGVSHERLLIWPHAADADVIVMANGTSVRRRLGLQNSFVVLYAGSFSSYYDVPNMVSAAKLLRQHSPEVRLLLVGDGPDRERVERMIQVDSLDNVLYLGPVAPEEIAPYFQVADLFIHSLAGSVVPDYLQDHFCTKACDYLMAGRPVVAVENGPCLGRLLKEIDAGVDVPARRPEALADAIARFAANRDEGIRCGANARRYACERLERMKVTEKFWGELTVKLNLPAEHRGVHQASE